MANGPNIFQMLLVFIHSFIYSPDAIKTLRIEKFSIGTVEGGEQKENWLTQLPGKLTAIKMELELVIRGL